MIVNVSMMKLTKGNSHVKASCSNLALEPKNPYGIRDHTYILSGMHAVTEGFYA